MQYRFGISLMVVVGIVIGILFFSNQIIKKPLQDLGSSAIHQIPTMSPIPFYDLTISYLREKEYNSQLGKMEKISEGDFYTSYLTSYTSDGLKINAQLTQPKGEVPVGGWPAIIFIHGYIPPSRYQTLQNYSSYVDYLAKNRFVVFKIDLRGHGTSEGKPTGAYYSSDYIVDVLNAYSAMESTSFVNPKKIGLWGHSMAGNVVMRSYAAKPEIPAVVIWAGAVYTYVDFSQYGIDDNSYQPPQMDPERIRRRQELLKTYDQPDQGNPFWATVAPTTYLKDLKGAVQIHHAQDDSVVSVEYSRNLDKLLEQNSIIHELHEYPIGGHNISGVSFNQAMQRTVDFFHQFLLPD